MCFHIKYGLAPRKDLAVSLLSCYLYNRIRPTYVEIGSSLSFHLGTSLLAPLSSRTTAVSSRRTIYISITAKSGSRHLWSSGRYVVLLRRLADQDGSPDFPHPSLKRAERCRLSCFIHNIAWFYKKSKRGSPEPRTSYKKDYQIRRQSYYCNKHCNRSTHEKYSPL